MFLFFPQPTWESQLNWNIVRQKLLLMTFFPLDPTFKKLHNCKNKVAVVF